MTANTEKEIRLVSLIRNADAGTWDALYRADHDVPDTDVPDFGVADFRVWMPLNDASGIEVDPALAIEKLRQFLVIKLEDWRKQLSS